MLHVILPGLLLAVVAATCAAQDNPRPDQARAEVPETRYTPPIPERPAEAPSATPDQHWIEANRTVGSYKPMMLTMPERPAPGEKGHH